MQTNIVRLVFKTGQNQLILDVFSGCIAWINLIPFPLIQASQDTSLEYTHAYIWRKYFFRFFRASGNLKWPKPGLNDGIFKRNFTPRLDYHLDYWIYWNLRLTLVLILIINTYSNIWIYKYRYRNDFSYRYRYITIDLSLVGIRFRKLFWNLLI